jgi:LacI family transcriptional regulator
VQALNDAPTDEREVNLLLQNRVDGLLTGPRCNRENERFYADLLRQGEKIVFIDQRMPMPDACNVFSDDLTGSRLAMEHLFSLGHRAIAHLGSAGPGLSSSASLRQQGYVNAMAAAGFESPPHWLLRVADGDVAAAVAELLHRSPEITAFFCFNDGRALELLDAVEGLGRRVPDDISIVGYGDNIAHARYLKVPLTTVAQDGEVIGRAATRLLLRMLNGEQGLAGDHLQPVRLIERASTCPCRQVKRPSR